MIDITIPNWTKFNPRSDRANYSWFRLQNGFFGDPVVFELSGDDQRLYLYLLCELSKKNKDSVKISEGLASSHLKIGETEVAAGIARLCDAGLIEARNQKPAESRQEAGITPRALQVAAAFIPATNVRDERTYETNETNERTDEGDEREFSPPPTPDHPITTINDPNTTDDPDIEPTTLIPALEGVVGSELLIGIPERVQLAWLRSFGDDVVKGELPVAYQRWLSNPDRAERGKLPLFLSHWFQNAKKDYDRRARDAPVPMAGKLSDREAEQTRARLAELDAMPKPDAETLRRVKEANASFLRGVPSGV